MAMDDVSPQRKVAMFKFHQAEQEMSRGHVDRGLQLAREAIREDPTYLDAHLWLAQRFVAMDEPRKASHELETVLHADPKNEVAWQLMEQVDPASANRLRRLQSIAPDPFVVQNRAPLTEDVAEIEDYVDDDEPVDFGGDGGDPFLAGDVDESVIGTWGDDEEEEGDYEEEGEGDEVAESTGAGANSAPHFWEYEQDRQFLAKWEAEPVIAEAVVKIQELWKDIEAWDYVLNLCAHANPSLHEKIFQAAKKASERLGVEMPELFVFPERCMHPVLIKDQPPLLAVPTGVLRAMTPDEALFQIGREIGHLNTGYLAQMQMVKIVTNRKAQLVGDLASTLRDFLGGTVKYWDAQLSRDEIDRLKKLGHAWQQRCELTADRAGLVCCGDVVVACTAIAKTTAKSIDEASTMTVGAFLKQFEHEDVGKLAAIPVEESPSRNPRYAAYRIHMLKWWATTPAGMNVLM